MRVSSDPDCPTSLALDDAGLSHLSYYSGYNYYNLQVAHRQPPGWQYQTVHTGVDVGKYNSLALDGDGNARISYFEDTNDDLWYAYQDISGWHTQMLDSDGAATFSRDSLYWPSLLLIAFS